MVRHAVVVEGRGSRQLASLGRLADLAGPCCCRAHIVEGLVEVVLDDELPLFVVLLKYTGLALDSAQGVSLGVEGRAVRALRPTY